MLIVAPLLAIALGLGFRWWYPRYLERRATEEVERLGGTITTEITPSWSRRVRL